MRTIVILGLFADLGRCTVHRSPLDRSNSGTVERSNGERARQPHSDALPAAVQDAKESGKRLAARAQLAQIGTACLMYKQMNGEEAASLQDLVEKPARAKQWPEGGFLLGGKVPQDPWGREYKYETGWKLPRLWTLGADGKEGGQGEDADLAFGNVFAAPAPEVDAGSIAKNEREAAAMLARIVRAQMDFRSNDRDGNLVNDYWTGDVHALYALTPIPAGEITPQEKPDPSWLIKLIAEDEADADAAPLRIRGLGRKPPDKPKPRAGYFLRAMESDGRDLPYANDTDGKSFYGAVHHRSQFGICAHPAEHGKTGTMTFIVGEDYVVLKKDTKGEAVLRFPAKPAEEGWKKAE